MNEETFRLSPEDLRCVIDLSGMEFTSTAEIPPLETTIGQDRAVRALAFGLRIRQEGYNIYASGISGTGKSTLVRNVVCQYARDRRVPDDWCYVYNFRNPENPRAVRLKAGGGRIFRKEMDRLVHFLETGIPRVFQSKDYVEERDRIVEKGDRAKQALFQEIVSRGRDLGFEIKSTRTGFSYSPVRKGKPLRAEEIQKLSSGERHKIEEGQRTIGEYLRDLVIQFQELDRETEAALEKFNQGAADFLIAGRFQELQEKYREHPRISRYLEEVYEDILKNFKEFLPSSSTSNPPFLSEIENQTGPRHIRYRVNLLVDHSNTKGAPLIEESYPTYANLVGRIEKRARFGNLQTDFTLIRPGSILKANGGYLVLNILDLLTHPFSWEALKKALENRELIIEDVGELYGVISTLGIKPEPIPVDLKVVIVGSPQIYSLLQYYDEDFTKLFKVKADFNTRTSRTPEEVMKYIQFTARICREEGLNPFDRSAVAELLTLLTRMVDHQDRLSLRFGEVANLIREAAFWSAEDGSGTVTSEHVEKAFSEMTYRCNLMEERIQEEIDEQVLLVDVEGARVGQVNGLVVYSVGDYLFGKPSRITSRTYLGRKGVISIERESELSGKTHSKGVMILSNYLGGRYAQRYSLSLSASLAFEQSYVEVDGDSASAGELIAILSSLSGIPVRQDLAITGSVNQHGEIQPVGGVNQKIEGFFQTCRNRGLTGSQGVIIPQQNVRHLCLKKEVVEAVRENRFRIYQVRHVDEAVALLTGVPAGERREDGTFPPETVNACVQEALSAMHERMETDHDHDHEEEEGN